MSAPSQATVKRLFAVSSNRCAFPKCSLELVDRPSGKVVARICHIRARSEGGPRYDPTQTDAERHGYENLLLLCPMHHDVVDADEVSYTVERLFQMKASWEAAGSKGNPFSISNELAEAVMKISEKINNIEGLALRLASQTNAEIVSRAGIHKESIDEQAAEKIMELWKLFNLAYGWLIDLTSPIQQYIDVNMMSEVQFEEWLTSNEFPNSSKEELRHSSDRTKRYSEIRVLIQLHRTSVTCTEFNNALVIVRPLLGETIKEAFNAVNVTMRKALSQMQTATEGRDYKMRGEAATIAFSLQDEIPRLEELIHKELYGS